MDKEAKLLECVTFITTIYEILDADEIAHFEKLHANYLKDNHNDYLERIIEYVEHLRKYYDR